MKKVNVKANGNVMVGFNTASGKYCCNSIGFIFTGEELSTCFNTASGKYCCNLYMLNKGSTDISVSIPQAVSTVATDDVHKTLAHLQSRFNTASGKYCCNMNRDRIIAKAILVSIPQAVSTVATCKSNAPKH